MLRRASAAIRRPGHDFGAVPSTAGPHQPWEPSGPSTRPIRTSPGCAIARVLEDGVLSSSTRPSTGRTRDSPSPTAGTDRSTPDWSCPPTCRRAAGDGRQPSSTSGEAGTRGRSTRSWVPPEPPEPPGPPPGPGSAPAGAVSPAAGAAACATATGADAVFRHGETEPRLLRADFGKITSEVIQHLAAVDGVQLEVRLEITAVAKQRVSTKPRFGRSGRTPRH